jgi:hypothetical protein
MTINDVNMTSWVQLLWSCIIVENELFWSSYNWIIMNCIVYIMSCNFTIHTTYLLATPTTGAYFTIQISSQTTNKEVSKSPLLRTIVPHKLLSFCDTITFTPVQSQVLHNSRTWYNRKTFSITTAFIHCLWLTLHQKLFVANPSPQRFSESTQKSIGFQYKI